MSVHVVKKFVVIFKRTSNCLSKEKFCHKMKEKVFRLGSFGFSRLSNFVYFCIF